MKLRIAVTGLVIFLITCAPYKQLQPKPELSPAESGYIELKNNKKDFVIKKDKKYFILFPAPQENNFYLVISNGKKKSVTSYLTAELVEKKKPGAKIADESETDTLSVFPVAKNSTGYYFIIEGTGTELPLSVTYRYTPQWRFKFENKHASYRETLAGNRVNRTIYESIGPDKTLEGMNFTATIDKVTKHRSAIDEVYRQLLAIESIFPPSIVNSTDEAYLNYKKLKADIEEEMQFQDVYLATLRFFFTEFSCRGNPLELVKAVGDFTAFFAGKDKIRPAVITEAQKVLSERLVEITPFYNQRFKGKNDIKPFAQETFFIKELLEIGALCTTAGITTPEEYTTLAVFAKAFNERSSALLTAQDTVAAIRKTIEADKKMPANDFFKAIVQRASSIKTLAPATLGDEFGDYVNYNCSEALNQEIAKFSKQFETDLMGYREADALVPELNTLKEQKDYSTMLGLLKQKSHLTFLLAKYSDLDKMSVEEQGKRIGEALAGRNWPQAEKSLHALHEDGNFLNPAEILPIKKAVVEEYEDSLYTRIDRYSRSRINKFVEENYMTVENVDSLYSDSVFLPAYDVTFSSGSRNELIRRKNELVAHLAKMKDDEFPAKAIALLYKAFLKNPNDNGVLKARAIVTHGTHYKGDNRKVKIQIAECDPRSMKWIVKPKQYRNVFAIPITSSKRGKNKYMVRFNVDIPTEANFPVYDVNIKLSKEIAGNAASEQWYDKITLNKKELKNEGRFTISAPTAANQYECQITPVQMTKGKGNILEITFSHPSFKVHQVSVMVQKPIIKKN
ncbi:MAG: hypothetical protein JW863_07250 [Chitinispirillaceae bacterium]|nr:hypothetical protein [Chitinispirillaceae bacterium]